MFLCCSFCAQVPNIPKKLEKFNNFLKGNYKVTDDNVRQNVVV